MPCLPCSFTLEICQTVRLVRHGRLLKRSPSCRCTHAAFCQTPLLHNWREMKRASGFCVTRFLPCLQYCIWHTSTLTCSFQKSFFKEASHLGGLQIGITEIACFLFSGAFPPSIFGALLGFPSFYEGQLYHCLCSDGKGCLVSRVKWSL